MISVGIKKTPGATAQVISFFTFQAIAPGAFQLTKSQFNPNCQITCAETHHLISQKLNPSSNKIQNFRQ
jgi:hypothetical protein